MKKILLSILFVISIFYANAQNFSAETIPQVLKNRATAVIRQSETTVDMRSTDNVILTVKKAITILNKNGDDHASLVLFYDKNTSIKGVKGEIYDEFGKLTSKFSLSNFKDESAVSNFSLYEDSRVKYYSPAVNIYPYTIVYTYEIRNKQNLVIPEWRPIPGYDIAAEKCTYQFVCNPKDELRIHAANYNRTPEEVLTDKQKILKWSVENVPAIKQEDYSPNAAVFLTSIKVAPKDFVYYNLKGSYTNWNELGKITYDNLLKNRQDLPAPTKDFIKELVSKEKTDRDKAQKIYKYMQQKTRYISVQLGIGGLQPSFASEVDKLGYGDCKGLVNYMQSLLDAVNIESYYCVVEAGNNKKDLISSFASMEQGNHIILCLPLKGDTTWLECTNQEIPFGYLGSFTSNRLVLACTKDGGKLLKTPKYNAENSLQERKASLVLSKEGNLKGNVTTTFKGEQYENHTYLLNKSQNDRENALRKIYDVNNINFDEIAFKKDEDQIIFTEDLKINVGHYAPVNNGKLFLNPNLLNVKKSIPFIRNRALPLYISSGYTDVDHISYTLDQDIVPEFQPKSVHIKNEFGSYILEVKKEDNKLVYYRVLSVKEGMYKAEDYTKFQEFISEVVQNDNLKLILSLKE